ncbi:adenylate/guanylate cyclase domain-containing protein [Neisseria sp. Ec49-e6-T10]|uniref:adenylate/guanylate cyclase domain-containing protein n=1 Tax=Neisseria sp. Ec49-e6-T10 TaxID=3140744 RepID=UPI003EBF9C21
MGLKEDLNSELGQIFTEKWDVQETTNIPDPDHLRLSNHAKKLAEATILYADLDGSTSMVDNYKWWFSAEIYKAYLRCAARIIKDKGGVITAYDGDRIMAVFTGNAKNTNAVKAAMNINYAVIYIIRPLIKKHYPNTTFELKHKIGIDCSEIYASRIGVRGSNDLVWVGRAANYAAKLTTMSGKPLWITNTVFNKLANEAKYSEGVLMWDEKVWSAMNNMKIYCSNYHWSF